MANPRGLRDIIGDIMNDPMSYMNYGTGKPRGRRKKPSPGGTTGGKSVRAGDKSLEKYRMPRKPRETPFDREKYQLPNRGPRKTKVTGGYGRPKPMPKKPRPKKG